MLQEINQKAVGRIAEARFLCDAVANGLTVCTPFGETKGWDFVVVGHKPLRVQVKSASRPTRRKKSHAPKYQIEMRTSSRRRSGHGGYAPNSYDILACWLGADSVWVFLDPKKVRIGTRIAMFPGHGPAARLNNWGIFDRAR